MFLEALFAERGTKVYTDDHVIFRELLFDHEVVWHLDGECVWSDAHTQGIESFWAMLKRAHKSTFHKFCIKHMHRYVTEFSGGQSFRNVDTVFKVHSVASNIVRKRQKYKELVAN